MGMPRGSKWKRLVICSDGANGDPHALVMSLRMHGIEMEWWRRTVPRGQGNIEADNSHMNNLLRDESPTSEAWLMVRRGDWPMGFVLAKHCGMSL